MCSLLWVHLGTLFREYILHVISLDRLSSLNHPRPNHLCSRKARGLAVHPAILFYTGVPCETMAYKLVDLYIVHMVLECFLLLRLRYELVIDQHDSFTHLFIAAYMASMHITFLLRVSRFYNVGRCFSLMWHSATAPLSTQGETVQECARAFQNLVVPWHGDMRSVLLWASIKGREMQLHPTVTLGCNYMPLPMIPGFVSAGYNY